jgi:HPt (histidine-containing phosphotransfer) domain-containing protein
MINWELFQAYVGWQEPDDLLDMIRTFLDRYPPDMQKLETAVRTRDYKQVNAITHNMKVHCGQFGAEEAARLAQRLETMGNDETDEDLDLVFSHYVAETGSLASELKQFCETAAH